MSKIAPKSERQQQALDKGTAFHSAVELWAKTGDLGGVLAGLLDDEVRGWVELLAMTWAPPLGAHFELALGLSPGGGYCPVVEPEPHVYVAAPGVGQGNGRLLTAGRADVVADVFGVAVVRDWKTGRYPVSPPAENLQLTALAIAAASALGCPSFVREIYYVRDGALDSDPHPVLLDSDEGMAAWEMVEAAAQLDDSPRPGEWCTPCWERRLRRCDRAQVAA
ncbi:MAG TPA: PD-(D/E)XK nuclease family protein [Thermomicrobiaceae bacterium]|nr:PD-(D/E)XK nuclease family protein [Thermomicrobiaceae bacterium]